MPAQGRINSINYLRGVAALLVMIAHWSGLFRDGDAMARFLQIEVTLPPDAFDHPLYRSEQYITGAIKYFWPIGFQLASAGVLLFFLISGFVISKSLRKYSPRDFLLLRAFRLFPVIIFSLILIYCLRAILVAMGLAPSVGITIEQFLTNVTLTHDLFWHPHIDNSLWTLLVELKFYIFMAALFLITDGKFGIQEIMLSGIALLAVSGFFFSGTVENVFPAYYQAVSDQAIWAYTIPKALSESAPFMIFMLIGSVHFEYYEGNISAAKSAACSLILLLMYGISYISTQFGPARLYYVEDGARVLLIFSLVIFCTKKKYKLLSIGPLAFVLNKLANISYPLYLIHGMFGMTLIVALASVLHSVTLAYVIGAAVVFGFVFFCHAHIEERGNKLGTEVLRHLRQGALRGPNTGSNSNGM